MSRSSTPIYDYPSRAVSLFIPSRSRSPYWEIPADRTERPFTTPELEDSFIAHPTKLSIRTQNIEQNAIQTTRVAMTRLLYGVGVATAVAAINSSPLPTPAVHPNQDYIPNQDPSEVRGGIWVVREPSSTPPSSPRTAPLTSSEPETGPVGSRSATPPLSQ